jgi:hypothetical protein
MKERMREVIEDYLAVSSIQGFQYLAKHWTMFERVFWFAILVTSFVLSGLETLLLGKVRLG